MARDTSTSRKRARRYLAGLGAVLFGAVLAQWGIAQTTTAPATQPAATPLTAAAQPATTQARPRPKIDEEFTLGFLKQYEPDVYKCALLLKDKDDKKYVDFLKEMMTEVRGLTDLQRRNPELFSLTMDDRRLAYETLQLAKVLQDQGLAPEVRQAKTSELTQLVNQQFTVRQKMRQAELDEKARRIADIQQRIGEQRKDLEDREKNKDTLMQQRIGDLLNKNAKVEW